MIQKVRAFAKSPFVFLLLIPIILAFAATGITDPFGRGGTAVAIVGPEQISVRDMQRAYDLELRRIQQNDPRFTREQAEEIGLGRQLLDRLAVNAALKAKADELGVGVSPDAEDRLIMAVPDFQNPVTGRFDYDTAASLLAFNGLTFEQYREGVREQLLLSQLTAPVFSGVAAPDQLALNRYAYSQERRTLRGMILRADPSEQPEDPGDEVLQQVVSANQDYAPGGVPVFAEPERRAFTLVRFRVSDYAADIEIDESELRELYDYQLDVGQIGTPATRSWSQARFDDSESALAAAESAAAGEDLQAASDAHGGGSVLTQSEQEAFQVPDEALREALFQMGAGETRAVEGSFGWFVVQVSDAVEEDIPSFEDRLPELRAEFARVEAENLMFDVIGAFESARADGATLEQAALQSGAVIEVFPPLDTSRGFNADGLPPQSLLGPNTRPAEVEILRAALTGDTAASTELTEYGEGDYFVLRVDEVLPAASKPLDEVRNLALAFWRNQEINDALEAEAEAVLARLNAGEDMQAIADEIGAAIETATLRRDETAGPFDRFVVAESFARAPGGFGQSAGADGRSHVIYTTDSVLPADPGVEALAQIAELETQITDSLGSDLALELQTALLREYGYTESSIDQRLLAQALGLNTDQR